MTEKDQVEVITQIASTLLRMAKHTSPHDFKKMFLASVANTVGMLPDFYWEKMKVFEPCDIPDCNCHTLATDFMAAVDIVRKDHIKTMEGRHKGN